MESGVRGYEQVLVDNLNEGERERRKRGVSRASLLLAQGEPLTYVANQLGQANPGITLKIYSHWIPKESQREAVNKLPSLTRRPTEAIRSATK